MKTLLQTLLVLFIIGVVVFVYLWGYDFDLSCLFVNCVRLK
jgi:hypothetical protein